MATGCLKWFFREPLYRIILYILYCIDIVSNILRYINCLNDKKDFNAKKQEELAFVELNRKGIFNTNNFDDTSHARNMNIILPDLWNDWYIYGRLFPTMFIQPSLERKRMVEIVYNKLKRLQEKKKDDVDLLSLPTTIFIVGMPRTGSTFLHKILALDNTTYSPKQWELKFPTTINKCIKKETNDQQQQQQDGYNNNNNNNNMLPEKGISSTTTRIHEANEVNKWTYKMMPRLSKIHNVGASDPDECVIGFVDCAFPEYYLWGCRNMSKSYNYYLKSKMEEQYMNYKKQLIVSLHDASTSLSNEEENKRQNLPETTHLVLKSPHHTCKLQTISKIFPNSIFVWLHRPLENVVASTCSMNETLNDYSDVTYEPRKQLGRRTLKRLAEVMSIGMKEREEIINNNTSGCKFIDIYYEDLVRNPIEVVKKLYEECDNKKCSDEYVEQLKSYLKDDAEKRKQRSASLKNQQIHKYSLDDFSISKEDVDKSFQAYYKKYNLHRI